MYYYKYYITTITIHMYMTTTTTSTSKNTNTVWLCASVFYTSFQEHLARFEGEEHELKIHTKPYKDADAEVRRAVVGLPLAG